jgi:hypothetical protein
MDPDVQAKASGAPVAPNRPRGLLALALRPNSGTPTVGDSLHNGQAGEQQPAGKINSDVTRLGAARSQQCL